MTPLPDDLLGRWLHSYEEDEPGIDVYRPADHDFPPSRGRKGMQFDPDGTYTDIRIGPTDRLQERPGRWSLREHNQLHLTFEDDTTPDRTLEVVECTSEVLKVRG